MDQGEFIPQGCCSFLPLDLQECGVVHGVVDQLADLDFLLFPSIDRGLVFVKSILRERFGVVSFEVEFSIPLDDGRRLKHGPNQVMAESPSRSGIKDPLVVGQPILTVAQELWELGDFDRRVVADRDFLLAYNLLYLGSGSGRHGMARQ